MDTTSTFSRSSRSIASSSPQTQRIARVRAAAILRLAEEGSVASNEHLKWQRQLDEIEKKRAHAQQAQSAVIARRTAEVAERHAEQLRTYAKQEEIERVALARRLGEAEATRAAAAQQRTEEEQVNATSRDCPYSRTGPGLVWMDLVPHALTRRRRSAVGSRSTPTSTRRSAKSRNEHPYDFMILDKES